MLPNEDNKVSIHRKTTQVVNTIGGEENNVKERMGAWEKTTLNDFLSRKYVRSEEGSKLINSAG